MLGTLDWGPANERRGLLADPVAAAIGALPDAEAAAIDPELADTAAFCERYDVPLDASANCVVVAAPHVVIGSGLRKPKLLLPGKALTTLPAAEVIAPAL